MTNRQKGIVIIFVLMFGLCTFAFGRSVGVKQQTSKYEELKVINNNLYYVIEELENNYDELEIQYKRDLEDCQTMFGDYQDKVEAGCFVNGGWNCE